MRLKKTKNILAVYLKNTWKVQYTTGKISIVVGEKYFYKRKWYIDKWEDGIKPSWVKRFNDYHAKIFKPQTHWDAYLVMKSESQIIMFYGSGYYEEWKCKYVSIFGFRVQRIFPMYTINGQLAEFNVFKAPPKDVI